MHNNANKICIGTAQFGLNYGISNKNGKTNIFEISKILEISKNNGIKFIDTANSYGTSESTLGKFKLNDFSIISKYIPPDAQINNISKQLELTLNNLNVESIYGYLSHRPNEFKNNPERWDELIKLKSIGKVKKIGISLNTPNEIEIIEKLGIVPDIIQAPYNYLDNRFKNIFIKYKAIGTEIFARSVFLQGLFFLKKEDLAGYFNEVKDLLELLQNNYNDKLPACLLKYVIEEPFVDYVLIGIENSLQLKYNISNLSTNENLPNLSLKISDKILTPSLWPSKK